jgi:hypothetical protein
VLLALVFKNPVGGAAAIAGLMTAFYVPMAYYLDRTLYNYRQRKEARAKLEKAQSRAGATRAPPTDGRPDVHGRPVAENTYVFRADGSDRALIVDPGDEAEKILGALTSWASPSTASC